MNSECRFGVNTSEDFADFIGKFRDDLELDPDSWEKSDLQSF